jgi:hypothetical protein
VRVTSTQGENVLHILPEISNFATHHFAIALFVILSTLLGCDSYRFLGLVLHRLDTCCTALDEGCLLSGTELRVICQDLTYEKRILHKLHVLTVSLKQWPLQANIAIIVRLHRHCIYINIQRRWWTDKDLHRCRWL